MTFEEFTNKLNADPGYVSTIGRMDVVKLSAGWSDEQKSLALKEWTRVSGFVTTFNSVTIAHPDWRNRDKEITDWGRELKSWAMVKLLNSSYPPHGKWAELADIPLGLLWEFQREALHNFYEVWYKGKRIPEDWA